MRYLLDTNVLSELRRASRADSNVVAWAQRHRPAELAISVITAMEIEIGITRMDRRDPEQGSTLRRWFEERVLAVFADRTLPVDLPVARRSVRLHVPDPAPERDALVAATALVHDLTVVTRNVSDFENTGVRIVNPWDAPV